MMSRSQLDALGVSTDLQTAADALGISKSAAYDLASKDEFPVRVIRVGSRYAVPTAGLREVLLGESPLPADEVVARLDRVAAAVEELVRHARVQSANSATGLAVPA
jgi:hypothetical protein